MTGGTVSGSMPGPSLHQLPLRKRRPAAVSICYRRVAELGEERKRKRSRKKKKKKKKKKRKKKRKTTSVPANLVE